MCGPTFRDRFARWPKRSNNSPSASGETTRKSSGCVHASFDFDHARLLLSRRRTCTWAPS
ncbi:hypothetical protein [Streptomyces asiaticus]